MAGGVMKYDGILNACKCGGESTMIWHFVKGSANRIHYFVRCNQCANRSKDRRKIQNAAVEWNYKICKMGE